MNFIFVHKIVIANAKLSARKKERTKRKNFNKEKIIVIDIEIEDRITQTKKKLLEKYHISRHWIPSIVWKCQVFEYILLIVIQTVLLCPKVKVSNEKERDHEQFESI